MSLFDRIFGERPKLKKQITQTFQTFTAYTPTFTSWEGGVYESEQIRAAIDARARHISKLKVIFEGSAKKTFTTYAKRRPNEYMTWAQFLYRVSTILDVQGSAFICPIIDRYNEIGGYYPVLPSRCEVVTINGAEWLRYQFNNGQIGAVELSRCGILTKHQYRDDFFGEKATPVLKALEVIHLNREGIKRGIKDAPKLQFTARLTNFRDPEDMAEEQKAFAAGLEGDTGAFTLFPSTYDSIQRVKSEPYVVPKDEADRIDAQIKNYYGVNDKVMRNEAVGDELDAFFDGAVEPFAIQLSEVLTRMTFTDNEQSYGARVEIAPNRLQYMRTSDKIAFIREMGDRGLMTVNEIRELLNYPTVANGDTRPARGEYFFIGEDGTILKKDNNETETETEAE